MLEVELARPVVAHFDSLGMVFPEVRIWEHGDRADLVCLRSDGSLDAVEIKTHPCAALLRQVRCWGAAADRVWAAYEPPRRGAVTQQWLARFGEHGVGVLHVCGIEVTVKREAAQQERVIWRDRLRSHLSPLHAEYGEAGNAESRFLSAFRVTCDNLRDAIRERPGITIRDAVAVIGHHYSSDSVARSSLMAWIRARKIAGVEARELQGSRAFGLFLTASAPEGA